jgi:hypothetical protein
VIVFVGFFLYAVGIARPAYEVESLACPGTERPVRVIRKRHFLFAHRASDRLPTMLI